MSSATALVKLLADVKDFSKGLTTAQREFNAFGQAMVVAGARASASLTVPLVAAGAAVYKFGSSFETAMAGVTKTVGKGNADIKTLGLSMRALSKETIFSAKELAEFTRLGAQLGVGTDEKQGVAKNTKDLQAFTKAIADLAVAANELSPEQAAKGVAKLINVVGEDISKDVSRVTNTIALLGDTLPTTEEKILGFAVQIAGIAKVAKLGTAEILGIAGGLSSVTNGTERAASAFQKWTTTFVGAVQNGGDALAPFADVLDMTQEQIQKTFAEKGTAPLFLAFEQGLARMAGEGTNTFEVLKDLGFGNVKVLQTLLAAAGGVDQLALSMKNATENPRRLTKAMDEVSVMLNTAAAQAGIVKDTFVDLFIELFTAFEKQIRFVIETIRQFAEGLLNLARSFTSLPEFVKTTTLAFLALLAALGPALFLMGNISTTGVALVSIFSKLASGLGIYTTAQQAANIATAASAAAAAKAKIPTVGRDATTGVWTKLAAPVVAEGSIGATSIAAGAAALVALKIAAAGVVGFKIGEWLNEAAVESRGFADQTDKTIEKLGLFTVGLSVIPAAIGQGFSKIGGIWANLTEGMSTLGQVALLLAPQITIPFKIAIPLVKDLGNEINKIAGADVTTGFFKNLDDMTGITAGIDLIQTGMNHLANDLFDVDEAIIESAKQFTLHFVALEQTAEGFEKAAARARQYATELTVMQFLQQFPDASPEQLKELEAFIIAQRNAIDVEIENNTQIAKEILLQKEVAKATKEHSDAVDKLTKSFQAQTHTGIAKQRDLEGEALLNINIGDLPISDQIKLLETFTESLGRMGGEGSAAYILLNEQVDAFYEKLRSGLGDLATLPVLKMGLPTEKEMAAAEAAQEARDNLKNPGGFKPFGSLSGPTPSMAIDPYGIGGLDPDFLPDFDDANTGAQALVSSVTDLNQLFKLFGVESNSAFGLAMSGAALLAGELTSLTMDSKSRFASADGAGAKAAVAAGAAIQGITGVMQATRQGSTKSRALGGATQGSAAGAQFGPIGAAVGAAAGAVVGWIRGSRAENRFKEIESAIGLRVSDALREGIEQAAKDLDLDLPMAALLSLGEAINEAGGITEDNFEEMGNSFQKLITAVSVGSVPLKEGTEAIADAFSEMVDGLSGMGTKGQVEIGKMVNEMQRLGVASETTQQFLADMAMGVISNFTPMIDLLAKQFGPGGIFEEGAVGIAAAEANLGLMVATFGAAVQAAGGLGGAIALLPESFGAVLTAMRELLGPEDEVLNKLTQFYNFAKENQEVLSAIDGLILGMGQLAAMGALNATNINAFTASAVAQMEGLLASTGNQTLALQAMGPQIGELMALYADMGLQVPASLQAIADKALEAGANLTPPEGIEDILASIRDILLEVAAAFGVAGTAAGNFNTQAAGGKVNPNGPNTNPKGPDGGFAAGGIVKASPGGSLVTVGEGGEDEAIIPASKMGGTTINVRVDAGIVTVNKNELADAIADAIGIAVKDNLGDVVGNMEKQLDGAFARN